jgi:hypothetical protein
VGTRHFGIGEGGVAGSDFKLRGGDRMESGDASSLPLSYLVEALSSHDAQLLDELQLLVETKRRELQSRENNNKVRDAKGREQR